MVKFLAVLFYDLFARNRRSPLPIRLGFDSLKKTNYVISNTNNGPIFPGYLWFLRLVYQPRVMRFNNSSFHSVVKKCIQQDVIICKVRYK